MGTDRLDVRLGQLDRPLVQIRSAGLLDRRNDVRRRHRTEQLAGVRRRLHGQLYWAEALDRGLELFGVLEALLHLGPLSQCEVARKLLRSDGNLTLVVNNLEKAGLVHRQRDPVDRRRVILHLTASGRKTIAGVFPDHLARIVELLSVLTADEQITLGNLCRKVGLAAQRRAEGQAR